jgi:hypothetical protein
VRGFGIFTFGIFTLIYGSIWDFYIWGYFVREKFMAPFFYDACSRKVLIYGKERASDKALSFLFYTGFQFLLPIDYHSFITNKISQNSSNTKWERTVTASS